MEWTIDSFSIEVLEHLITDGNRLK